MTNVSNKANLYSFSDNINHQDESGSEFVDVQSSSNNDGSEETIVISEDSSLMHNNLTYQDNQKNNEHNYINEDDNFSKNMNIKAIIETSNDHYHHNTFEKPQKKLTEPTPKFSNLEPKNFAFGDSGLGIQHKQENSHHSFHSASSGENEELSIESAEETTSLVIEEQSVGKQYEYASSFEFEPPEYKNIERAHDYVDNRNIYISPEKYEDHGMKFQVNFDNNTYNSNEHAPTENRRSQEVVYSSSRRPDDQVQTYRYPNVVNSQVYDIMDELRRDQQKKNTGLMINADQNNSLNQDSFTSYMTNSKSTRSYKQNAAHPFSSHHEKSYDTHYSTSGDSYSKPEPKNGLINSILDPVLEAKIRKITDDIMRRNNAMNTSTSTNPTTTFSSYKSNYGLKTTSESAEKHPLTYSSYLAQKMSSTISISQQFNFFHSVRDKDHNRPLYDSSYLNSVSHKDSSMPKFEHGLHTTIMATSPSGNKPEISNVHSSTESQPLLRSPYKNELDKSLQLSQKPEHDFLEPENTALPAKIVPTQSNNLLSNSKPKRRNFSRYQPLVVCVLALVLYLLFLIYSKQCTLII